jgi:hypothetical protein
MLKFQVLHFYQIELRRKDDDGAIDRSGENHATKHVEYIDKVYIKCSLQTNGLFYCFHLLNLVSFAYYPWTLLSNCQLFFWKEICLTKCDRMITIFWFLCLYFSFSSFIIFVIWSIIYLVKQPVNKHISLCELFHRVCETMQYWVTNNHRH